MSSYVHAIICKSSNIPILDRASAVELAAAQ